MQIKNLGSGQVERNTQLNFRHHLKYCNLILNIPWYMNFTWIVFRYGKIVRKIKRNYDNM